MQPGTRARTWPGCIQQFPSAIPQTRFSAPLLRRPGGVIAHDADPRTGALLGLLLHGTAALIGREGLGAQEIHESADR